MSLHASQRRVHRTHHSRHVKVRQSVRGVSRLEHVARVQQNHVITAVRRVHKIVLHSRHQPTIRIRNPTTRHSLRSQVLLCSWRSRSQHFQKVSPILCQPASLQLLSAFRLFEIKATKGLANRQAFPPYISHDKSPSFG